MARRFPLEIIVGATDRASAVLNRLSDRVERFYSPFNRLRQTLGRFADRTGLAAVGTALRDVGSAAVAAARRVAVGITAATVALGAFIFRNMSAADSIGDTAARLNIGTKALQAYTHGFNLADVAPESLTSALDTLNKNLGLAQIGMGKALPLFRGLAIDPRKFRTIDELLPVLADRLSRIRDPAKRAAIATRLLGDAGAQMAVKLAEGPKALAEMREAAERAGVVLREDTIRAAGELDTRLKALRATFAGVAGNALGRLYPALIRIAAAVQTAIVKYQPQIEAFATQFANNLPRYIENTKEAFGALHRALQPVFTVVSFLVEKFGAGNVVLGALAILITGKLIASLITLGTTLSGLGVSLSVAFGVPALIIGGIVALVAAGWWLYRNWDDVSMAIGDAIDWMREKFNSAWEWLRKSAVETFDWLAAKLKYHPLFLMFKGLRWIAGKTSELWGMGGPPASGAAIGSSLMQPATLPRERVDVRVDLSNLPAGTRASAKASSGVDFELSRGYAMPGLY
jgi:hypothetical protein